jgi:hypothetical protein
MAFNPAPSAWLDALSEDGTDITVPLATFPELTAAEADGATGDVRKVTYAVLEKLYQEYAGRPEADRPQKMQLVKGQALNSAGQIVTTYSFTFVLEAATIDVAAE